MSHSGSEDEDDFNPAPADLSDNEGDDDVGNQLRKEADEAPAAQRVEDEEDDEDAEGEVEGEGEAEGEGDVGKWEAQANSI